MKGEDVIDNFARSANSDIGDYFDEKGQFLGIKNIPEDKRKNISAITIKPVFGCNDPEIKIKQWSQDKANENLAKHHNLFEKDNAGKQMGPIVITLSREDENI